MKTKLFFTLILSALLCFASFGCGEKNEANTEMSQDLVETDQYDEGDDETESDDEIESDDYTRVIKNGRSHYKLKKCQAYQLSFSKAVDDNENFENDTVNVLKDTSQKAGVTISVNNYDVDTVSIPLWTVDLDGYEKYLVIFDSKKILAKPLNRVTLLTVGLDGMSAEKTGYLSEDEFQTKLQELKLRPTYFYENPGKDVYVDVPYEKRDDLKTGRVMTVDIEVIIPEKYFHFSYNFCVGKKFFNITGSRHFSTTATDLNPIIVSGPGERVYDLE